MEQLKQWKAASDKNLVSSGENRHQLQKAPLVMKNRKLKKEEVSCFLIHWL